jgi:hypothetical protein
VVTKRLLLSQTQKDKQMGRQAEGHILNNFP